MRLAAFFVGLLAVGGDGKAPDGGGVPVDHKQRIPPSGELESTFRRRLSLSYSGIGSLYGSYDAIAGYTPATDVADHAMIDLDMTAINDAMDDGDYATANDIYRNGANSVKGTGYRTLAGFSKNLAGEDEWQMGATYWGSDTYADGIVSDALSGGTYTYMYQRSGGSCCECGRARARCADARAARFCTDARARGDRCSG